VVDPDGGKRDGDESRSPGTYQVGDGPTVLSSPGCPVGQTGAERPALEDGVDESRVGIRLGHMQVNSSVAIVM
jgi:hypothetical protein